MNKRTLAGLLWWRKQSEMQYLSLGNDKYYSHMATKCSSKYVFPLDKSNI